MGAEVIKVEDTGAGDYSRDLAKGRMAMSPMFHLVNRGKKSIAIDLRRDAGRSLFLRLAEGADAVVEGFRPGVVDRLGVGYEAVKAVNPAVVYAAISGYGQTGPWRERAGHDINYLSTAGVSDQIGAAGGPPQLANFQIADLAGGTLTAAMGILAALVQRLRTGEGRYVDVSMTDAAFAHSVVPVATMQALGAAVPRGMGMLTGGLPCYNIYETGDGRYMGVGSLEAKFWHMLCDAIGRPDLKEKHWVVGAEAEAVKAEVAAAFKTRTQAEWAEVFAEVDCCVAPVLGTEEALEHPQLQAREMVCRLDDPEDGSVTVLGRPLKFDDDAPFAETATPAPRHGEHTAPVLAALGVSDDDMERLRGDGTILCRPLD
jgi:crotonobetainyl-CoA:carnitine CoA-transferase CaiB-like acyl-CoA transferase